MAAAGVVAPLILRGTNRQFRVPSSVLAPNDLRRLYRLLAQKASEAADRQVAQLMLQPGQTQEQLDHVKNQLRNALSLVLRVQTASGEWVGSTTEDPLSDEQLPSGIVRIDFDSSFTYRAQLNGAFPNNYFNVTLDVSRPDILDMNNVPIANGSTANIAGIDATWANGLHDELVRFFRERPSKRGWLHLRACFINSASA